MMDSRVTRESAENTKARTALTSPPLPGSRDTVCGKEFNIQLIKLSKYGRVPSLVPGAPAIVRRTERLFLIVGVVLVGIVV